jgi:hypothetical protein
MFVRNAWYCAGWDYELSHGKTRFFLARLHGIAWCPIGDRMAASSLWKVAALIDRPPCQTLPDFMPAKERYFRQPFPTWTIPGVQALALPALKIEVRSIAALK